MKRQRDEGSAPSEAVNVPHDYLKMILTAPVYDVAKETSLHRAPLLSQKMKNTIYLKREDEQPVFSFKIRGAYNRMVTLSDEELKKGVLACSAGNHAQGVALAAQRLKTRAVICMPTCTPAIKVDAVRRLGAEVVLKGTTFDEAKAECIRRSKETGCTIIHPYDDPYVIAGQGTIAVEIFRQIPVAERPDAIFCCIGGGGMVAGILQYTKKLFPNVKVFGVEAEDAASMKASIEAGRRVELSEVGLFADGAAVKLVGAETFRIAHQLLDGVVTVSNDEICAAIKDTFLDTRTIVEPAGALAVAGVKKYIEQQGVKGKRFVAVTSGANMNFNRLRFVSERCEMGENREVLLSVIIPEREGSFLRMYQHLYPHNLTEFSYRYREGGQAFIFLAIEVEDKVTDVQSVIAKLRGDGMDAQDVTENELAKSHARYLIGGRANVANERLFMFEFPEKVGALKTFLEKLQSGFNVSLFHYRNCGSDYGRVMVGMQIPQDREKNFAVFLENLGYPFRDETGNDVYHMYLR